MPTPPASGLLLDETTPSRRNVCVTSSSEDKPNYALSNSFNNSGKGYWFKDSDLTAELIWLPTAEHYLQFQKLTGEAKKKITQTPELIKAWQEAKPGEILEAFTSTSTPALREKFGAKEPSTLKYGAAPSIPWTEWNTEKIMVQMQINAIKYQQSKEFRDAINMAIEMGKKLGGNSEAVSIIADTTGATTRENEWGSGPNGTGQNILGNTQTAYAEMVRTTPVDPSTLLEPSRTATPSSAQLVSVDPTKTVAAYATAKNLYQNNVQPTLTTLRSNMPDKTKDTSESPQVKPIDPALNPVVPSPTSSAALRQGDVSFIIDAFQKRFPPGSGGNVEKKDTKTVFTFPAEDKKPAEDVAKDFFNDLTKAGKPFLMQQYINGKPQDKYHFFSGSGDLLSGSKSDIEQKLQDPQNATILQQFQEAIKPKDAADFREQMTSGRAPQNSVTPGDQPPIQTLQS